jgi:predicted restriction endonuclease
MPRRNWTREELIVTFNLYCKLPFGQMHRGNPQVVQLAELLRRTPSAVAMKLVNFASLDPLHQRRGVSGLKNTSQADLAIWREFHEGWARLGAESELAYRQRLDQKAEVAEDQPPAANRASTARTGKSEAQRMLTVRLGQAFFREVVLASYSSRCCICDLPDGRLLVASHIIPWAKREDLRVNPQNGLCLCALHDRAFDRGLISVDLKMTLILSPQLRMHLPHRIVEQMFVAFEGERTQQPEKFLPEVDYLRYHQEHVFLA